MDDSAEDFVWHDIDPDHIWILDKLILSRKLKYNCGPVGLDVPKPGWYIVRPCVNMIGLGLGAQKVWLEKETMHLPVGHFWCEWFEGNHYSIDYMPQFGIKVNTILGIKDPNTFTKWRKWIKVEDSDQQRLPSVIFPLINSYPIVNLEYIEDKLIEVHLRRNEDFDGDINEFIPVWEGEDTNPPEGYQYRDYPDIHGRIGAFIK